MRILLIHADFIEYTALEPAIKEPEPIDNKSERFEECLVAFCSIEKIDEEDPKGVAELAAQSIMEHANMIGVKTIVLYPYAHLSSNLASPRMAMDILKELKNSLKPLANVKSAPFGWYKSFIIKCKGHPLSELSRTILPPEKKEKKEEKTTPSKFLILMPDGKEIPIDLSRPESFLNLNIEPSLIQLIKNEAGLKEERGPPIHIKLMKRLELVDYEPASDVGHFRFYPKGLMIKESLEAFATELAVKELKALKIETPMLYRLDEPDIAEQAAKFRERDYRLKIDNREFTLRFAGDFGLFRMMKDAIMSYKQLPIRVYELSHSFRLEQSGECVGLKRLRAFTMPDIHCFCANLNQGLSEYKLLFEKYTMLTNAMEIDYAIAFRVVEEFYEKNKEWFLSLLKIVNKSALIELLPEMKHYWILKHEYQAIDSIGGNLQLVTVQLDVEDATRYGIMYIDEDGQKKGCIILHSSMGSIERWMGIVLEQAAKNQMSGRTPKLPLWLSPIQVRVIPVSSNYLDKAMEIASKISQSFIRVDVDDRDESVPRKIRDAEMEWIPYIIVLGEKEVNSGELSVRIRGEGIFKRTLDSLISEISEKLSSKPRIPLCLPMLLSMRPKFA
ncbi:MAG: threonine--tRNA ligase [Candidatus Methanomethyliaceae archaeon]|nr:threonine--tRNA ligase [Candidatus Methanomethyliaceae archaeon]MDW7971479.1 threonine--tRNA ligase [Nitrososphaerota archaeon]